MELFTYRVDSGRGPTNTQSPNPERILTDTAVGSSAGTVETALASGATAKNKVQPSPENCTPSSSMSEMEAFVPKKLISEESKVTTIRVESMCQFRKIWRDASSGETIMFLLSSIKPISLIEQIGNGVQLQYRSEFLQ